MSRILYPAAMLLVVGALRLFELYWLEKGKTPGIIRAKWTLFVWTALYTLLLIGTVFEYAVTGRPLNYVVSLGALVVMLVRIPVKFQAGKALGKFWSPHIEIREGHRLVTSGPYRYVRHPVYAVALLDTVAIPLLLNAWYVLCTVAPLIVVLIAVRIRCEEKALLQNLGEEYAQYRRETFAVFPVPKKYFASFFPAGGER